MGRAHRAFALVFVLALSPSLASSAVGADSGLATGSLEQRMNALTKIQPGLGTVMAEYGNRFVNTYFAARGGNWALAQYQLNEMLEIQEVGEATRPEHAPSLKAFEDSYLKPLEAKIVSKDWSGFNTLYRDTMEGCNGCHAGTGHSFIHFKLPTRPVEDYLNFSLKSNPSPPAGKK